MSTISDRFWSKVVKTEGCWLWTGPSSKGRGPNPYGHFKIGRKHNAAHRWAYEDVAGPIPEGLTIDHLCRNTLCVNPAHLEPVTIRENILRGEGLAAIQARATHCPQGHPYDEENTYHNPNGRRVCRQCHKAHQLLYTQKHRETRLETGRRHDAKRRAEGRKH